MKRGTRDKLDNLYTVFTGWVAAAGVLLVLAAVFSQWRAGLEQFNLVWQTLTETIAFYDDQRGLPVADKPCEGGQADFVVAGRFSSANGCRLYPE